MAIKRLHYFNGQFLKEQDFTDEQNYHLEMRRRLNQRLHTAGIVFGLEVTAGTNKVTVQPGLAIDALGREIILESAADLTITAAAEVTVAYKEEETDESTETGILGKRRWTETAVLANAADPNGVVLARISNVSPVTLDSAFRRPYTAPRVLGDLEVKRDLTVQGNLTVQGETTTVQTERMRGNVVLGDEDGDTATVEGRLLTGHSSGRLQIASPVHIAGDATMTGPLTLAANPTAALHAATKQYIDAHAGTANPHSGSLAKTGDTMSGPLSITAGGTGLSVANNASVGGNLSVDGNVGVGTASPAEPLDVNGRIKSASLSVGPWPANPANYMHFGVNTLNQALAGNYALLQGVTDGPGRTFLNSPVDIRLRIGNADQMIVANNGNVGIGTTAPGDKLDVAGNVRILSGSNPIRFSGAWTAFPDPALDRAEISNDTGTFKTLMIVGNKSAGMGRRVSVWDRLEVNGPLLTSQAHTIKIGVPSPATPPRYGNDGIRGEPNLWLDAQNTVFIKQGFQTPGGFDIAERFKTAERVDAGDVVVFDEGNEAVKLCAGAYDRRIVGIVSKEPAFILGGNEEDTPVALCGRVLCNVDADIAPIAVGDLLTTSPTKGHGQKALDQNRTAGAIIGKALRALERGKGQILVLVMML